MDTQTMRPRHSLSLDAFKTATISDTKLSPYRWTVGCRGKWARFSDVALNLFNNYCAELYSDQLGTSFQDLVYPDLDHVYKQLGDKHVVKLKEHRRTLYTEKQFNELTEAGEGSIDLRDTKGQFRVSRRWDEFRGHVAYSPISGMNTIRYYGKAFQCDKPTLDAWDRYIREWFMESQGKVVDVPSVEMFPLYSKLIFL